MIKAELKTIYEDLAEWIVAFFTYIAKGSGLSNVKILLWAIPPSIGAFLVDLQATAEANNMNWFLLKWIVYFALIDTGTGIYRAAFTPGDGVLGTSFEWIKLVMILKKCFILSFAIIFTYFLNEAAKNNIEIYIKLLGDYVLTTTLLREVQSAAENVRTIHPDTVWLKKLCEALKVVDSISPYPNKKTDGNDTGKQK